MTRRWKTATADKLYAERLVELREVYDMRFNDFGHRLDDFASRIVSSDRFQLALLAAVLGFFYYTGDKMDKMNDKIDKMSEKMNDKIDKMNDKIDKTNDKLRDEIITEIKDMKTTMKEMLNGNRKYDYENSLAASSPSKQIASSSSSSSNNNSHGNPA